MLNTTSVPGPSRGKIHFVVPEFWDKFWNDKMNFTRVFVAVSPLIGRLIW